LQVLEKMAQELKGADRWAFALFLYAAFLLLAPFRAHGYISGLLGLVLVLVASFRFGVRGGLIAASWASGIMALTLFFSPHEVYLFQVLTGVAAYFLIALLLGKSVETINRQKLELKKNEQQLRDIIENQSELICRYLPDGTVTFVNQACSNFFTKTGGNASTERAPGFATQLQLTQSQPVSSYETKVVLPTGESRWYNWIVRGFFDGRGNIQEYQAVGRDITEQRQIEQKIQEYNLELEEKGRELEKLYHQLDEELDKARIVHERTMPQTLPRMENVSLAAHYQPAAKVGGDFYNVLRAKDKLVIYLSDVMGHGLEGALFSIFVKEAIDSYISLRADELSPVKILEHLAHQYRREAFPEDYFICIFLAVLDLKTMEMSYTGSGFHNTPLVRLPSGEHVELLSQALPISSAIPGELLQFREGSLYLPPGSTVLFYTDGLTEQQAGEERYSNRLDEVFHHYSGFPPEVIVQAINEDFRRYNHGTLQGDDDITFLVLQIKPEQQVNYELEYKSAARELNRLQTELSRIMLELKIDQEQAGLLLTCLHELVSNAVEHGNRLDPEKKVAVTITATDSYLCAAVEDEGEGFNWKEKVKNPLELEGRRERGRGIPMMQMCARALFYNEKGNRALLVIDISRM